MRLIKKFNFLLSFGSNRQFLCISHTVTLDHKIKVPYSNRQTDGYTHKTSGFKTLGFKTSGFETSETSGLLNVTFTNVRFTKRQVFKTSDFKTFLLVNSSKLTRK